jgi:eukaryotic-like serine/threonine-protein kinase
LPRERSCRDEIAVVLAPGTELKLKKKTWTVVGPLGGDEGGFGDLYVVEDEASGEAVAKLVKKAPAADREALIGAANEAAKHPNVVPVIDDGEHGDKWVLVMPRADISLSQHLKDHGGPLDPMDAVSVMTDVATALQALKGVVVHRDLKPANILLWNGAWSLTDFGLARYADEATGTQTWKYNGTEQYASPEQWRGIHATEAADVYAFGIVAYEMLAGQRPFGGPDYRDQHLNQQPPPLAVGSTRLRVLVEECLNKPPEARPSPSQILKRLANIGDGAPAGAGLETLAEANRAAVHRRAQADAQRSAEQGERERLAELHKTAAHAFQVVPEQLIEAIKDFAPGADLLAESKGSFNSLASGKAFMAILEGAQIGLDQPQPSPSKLGSLPFTVVSESVIRVTRPSPLHGWVGRGHSLWYCDAEEKDVFAWYELAFTTLSFSGVVSQMDPFDLDGIDAREALSPGITSTQLAWDFEELDRSDLSEFVNRWLGWFGLASTGQLQRPGMIPEKPPVGRRWWQT